MTQETAWLDYTKPPPGYAAHPFRGGGAVVHRFSYAFMAPDQMTVLDSTGTASESDSLAAAWSHYKREHDPPGMQITEVESVVPEIDGWGFTVGDQQWSADWSETEARVAAWSWHDRRRAIVLDIDEQTCSGGKHLAAWMALALAWTDAECAEVEAYAALPFPRSVDMPAPLQRVLLPEGPA